jgi:phosphoribosylglycinamide formyltransferase 1
MMRLAALASHGGSILQAVVEACRGRELDAELVLVISNNSRSLALARAAEQGIPVAHLSSKTHPDPDSLDQAMLDALQAARPDWVVLAGYMRHLGPKTTEAFRNRILNTHPSLLPKYGGRGFYGRRVHQAVLDAGDTESGATVHLVNEEYDAGPILAQVRVPVRPDDTAETLEERVKAAERKLIVATLRELTPRKAAAG